MFPQKSNQEKYETLLKEEGYVFKIINNIRKEKAIVREKLNLPDDSIIYDEMWVEAFSIIIDKTKNDQEKQEELNKKFIIIER